MDTSASSQFCPTRAPLRSELDSLLTHLREPMWDAEWITTTLAKLRTRLDERVAQQNDRCCESLAEAPWSAAEVRDLQHQGERLREALGHLQTRWSQRRVSPDGEWQRAFSDFALQVVEYDAQAWQLRREITQNMGVGGWDDDNPWFV